MDWERYSRPDQFLVARAASALSVTICSGIPCITNNCRNTVMVLACQGFWHFRHLSPLRMGVHHYKEEL